MRFAFWRTDKGETPVKNAAPVLKPAPPKDLPAPELGDLDLRAIWQTLQRKKRWVIIPTLCAFGLSLAAVNLITPRYKSEARILIDGRENIFLRPNGERNDERNALDPEAVTSQVQLVLSRDLAREVIKKNKLAENPEFDPVLRGVSPVKALLALFGIGRDPFRMTPDERVLDAYYERLTAYARAGTAADAPLLTRARHRDALERAAQALSQALKAEDDEAELFAEGIRQALTEIGRITGRVDLDELLDVVFRDFCIGK